MGRIREHPQGIDSIYLERTMEDEKSCKIKLTFDLIPG